MSLRTLPAALAALLRQLLRLFRSGHPTLGDIGPSVFPVLPIQSRLNERPNRLGAS